MVNELSQYGDLRGKGGSAGMSADGVEEPMLVRSAQSGNLAAFEKLYRSKAGQVYAVCLRMSGRPESAEDLTQEVFVRAWQKLAGFRGESGIGTWLTRLAVNAALNDLRYRERHEKRQTLTEDADAFAAPRAPEDAETAMDLERAIAELPAQARTVFVLHDVEGWKHREIARATGLAVGTCKSHLNRARKLLRGELSP